MFIIHNEARVFQAAHALYEVQQKTPDWDPLQKNTLFQKRRELVFISPLYCDVFINKYKPMKLLTKGSKVRKAQLH